MPESEEILDETVDYIIDCVDTVTAKIELVIRANKLNIPIISSMGKCRYEYIKKHTKC